MHSGLFISSDNGQNWNEDDFGLPAGSATYPVEMPNGDLYVIGSDASGLHAAAHTPATGLISELNGNFILSNVESLYID